VPRGLSLARTPACEECGTRIPFFRLRPPHTCANCGAELRYDRVEWPLAGLFLLLAFYYRPGTPLLVYSVNTVVLITVSAIDLRHRFIYAIVVYPAMLLALLATALLTNTSLVATLVRFACGLGIFAAFYFIGRLVYPGVEPVGKGDIELGALMGAMVGFPRVVSALFLGSVANAVVIAALLLLRRRGRRDFIPYGPGLCLGAFAAFFLSP